jgi:hypothetical protein
VKKTEPVSVLKNALTHGVYAQDLVLDWENEQDFVDLHKGLRDEFEPDGPAEEEAVLGIASLYWKKRRLMIGSQLSYRRQPDAAALSEAGDGGWRGVREYLESTSGKMESVSDAIRSMALAHARALQSTFEKLAALKFPPATPETEKLDRVGQLREESRAAREAERFDALIETLNAMGAKFISPALQIIECQDIEQSLAERAFRPDIIEREVKVGALIDRQIEKGLAQLVHLKEYKRLYKKKQVTGPGTM